MERDVWASGSVLAPALGVPGLATQTPIPSGQALANRLGRRTWLPTTWPDRYGPPEIFLVDTAPAASYHLRSSGNERHLVLIGRLGAREAPILDRPMRRLTAHPHPAWEATDGSLHLIMWVTGEVVLHLVGDADPDIGHRILSSIAAVTPTPD